MPDISMCKAACEASSRCYRHSNSGTKPSEFRQSYSEFKDMATEQCDGFWPAFRSAEPPKTKKEASNG